MPTYKRRSGLKLCSKRTIRRSTRQRLCIRPSVCLCWAGLERTCHFAPNHRRAAAVLFLDVEGTIYCFLPNRVKQCVEMYNMIKTQYIFQLLKVELKLQIKTLVTLVCAEVWEQNLLFCFPCVLLRRLHYITIIHHSVL